MNEERYEKDHPLLHAKLHQLTKMMQAALPAHMGFTLLVFDTWDEKYKDSGSLFYASTGGRQDNIKMLKEFVENLERHEKEAYDRVKIPPHKCTCGYVMDARMEVLNDSAPDANSISLCGRCAKIWMYNADKTMHEPTENEMNQIYKDPGYGALEKIRTEILLMRKK